MKLLRNAYIHMASSFEMKENIRINKRRMPMREDILIRDKQGDPVSTKEEDYAIIKDTITNAQRLISKLNNQYWEKNQINEIFSELTGKKVDDSFSLLPPFYTDYGRNIEIGKDVFINHCCEFMDRGGIYIGDGTFIGPKVNVITINHSIDPDKRYITTCKPVHIGKNVWIGIAATIMPGVTIGDNSIISAGAVVTKDVEANTIVAGVSAKKLRKIDTV